MSERDELLARLREGTFGTDITKTDVFLNTICSAAADQIEHDGREIERLTAENSRLREALQPFVDAADHAINAVSKTTTLGVLGALAPYYLTWQDFRRARAALSSTGEKE